MASSQLQHAIGIFLFRQSAVQALDEMRSSGFPMNKVSVITKKPQLNEQFDTTNMSEPSITPYEGALSGGLMGATAGGLLGLIGGFAVLLVPGIGPAIAAESILIALLGSGASAAAGGLIGALQGWFVPEEIAQLYNERVFQGNYLVTIEGTEEDIRRAKSVLSRWGIQDWRVFNVPAN